MTNDERALNRILIAAGIFMVFFGCLATWRGIFFLIPFAGLQYGLTMTILSVVLAVAGVIVTVRAVRKGKKWKKDLEEQAAAQGQDSPEQ